MAARAQSVGSQDSRMVALSFPSPVRTKSSSETAATAAMLEINAQLRSRKK